MELSLNKRMLAALFLGSVMACDTGDKDDPIDDTDDTLIVCVSGIASTFPDLDATGVFYRTAIQVDFLEDESVGGTLAVADDAGAAVTGTTTFSADGETAWFTPDADLAASTTYNITVSYSCGDAVVSFTTSAVGTPVDSAVVLNNTYNIDIATGRFVEPAGVGDLLAGLIADQDVAILISPTAYTDPDMTFIGSLGETAADGTLGQDLCTETIDFPVDADYSENPFFAIEGNDVVLAAAGITIELSEILVSGAFAADGNSVEGVLMDGTVDTRPLGAIFDLGDTDDAVCTLVSGFGITCEACSDGEPLCLSLLVDNMVAPGLGFPLVPLTADDIAAKVAAGDCAAE